VSASPDAFLSLQSVLHGAGPAAEQLTLIAWVLIVGASVVFGLTMALLAWSIARHKRPDVRPATWLVGGGIVFPGVVLSALLAWVTWGPELSPPHDPNAMVISVTGRSWWWEVEYLDPAGGPSVQLANQIHLPAGRSVLLALKSEDVIHSFWVPAIAGKVDMLPGRVHHLRVMARDLGTYRGQCAEFCGEQHARMALHVVVQTEAEFARWLVAQARPAAAPIDERAMRGLKVFNEQRCSACHRVQGLTADTRVGPDLTHVGSRIALGAGTLRNDEATMRSWVTDVHRFKPGARMPTYARLDDASLNAVAHFLAQLK
jgi:cytochrome c oxidase subunit 2